MVKGNYKMANWKIYNKVLTKIFTESPCESTKIQSAYNGLINQLVTATEKSIPIINTSIYNIGINFYLKLLPKDG